MKLDQLGFFNDKRDGFLYTYSVGYAARLLLEG
jgi:hypothetical protein